MIWVFLLGKISGLYLGKYTSVTLLEYQSGIVYRNGYPARNVGAGLHRIWSGREKIFFVDARPIFVNLSNQVATLSDGSIFVYDVRGSALISDVKKNIVFRAKLQPVAGIHHGLRSAFCIKWNDQ